MKKLCFIIGLIIIGFVGVAYADLDPDTGDYRQSDVVRVFAAEAVTASGTATSSVIQLKESTGFFAVQVYITGAGTVKIEYLISIDGVTYLEPSSASDIATGLTNASGPGSDGIDIFTFSPILAPYMKIKLTETGAASTAYVTLYLVTQ